MNDLLPFVIAGVTTGSVYALAGSGLVLTYRTSGMFNFAHGAIAAAAAYFFYWLTVDVDMPWVPAFLLSVVALGGGLGVVFELGARLLVHRGVSMQIVAAVGFILVVQSLATLKYGPDPLHLAHYLPNATFRLGGVNVGYDQVTIVAVALVSMVLLSVLLYRARIGLAMRAVVDNDELAGLHGTSATSTRRIAWALGSMLAAASGVLLAPAVGIDAIGLTYLVVAAIGAAAVGGFSNLFLTGLGGVLIGVVAALSEKWVLNVEWLSGVPMSLPFIVLMIALVVLPRGKLLTRAVDVSRPRPRVRAPRAIAVPTAAVVVGFLVVVPSIVGSQLPLFMQGLTLAIMFLSLGLLVRTAGQVSLCHAAFGAIGAMTFSQLVMDREWPWFLGLLGAGVVVVPVAAVIALLAVRLNGLFLALATLAFGIMVENLFYRVSFGFTDIGRSMPRPEFALADGDFYYVLLAIFLLVAVAMACVERGRLGRMLRGLAEAPVATRTLGLNVTTTRVIVFCVSAFVAAVAGTLYGCVVQYASYSDPQYLSFNSLVLIASLALAPFMTPWFSVFGILFAVVPGYLRFDDVSAWMNLVFGIFALLTAMQGGVPTPSGVVRLFRRLSRPVPIHSTDPPVTSGTDARTPATGRVATAPGLEVSGVTVRFGGLVAVDGVSLAAPKGRITGLIGPNGAGKTTIFNACSGLVRPAVGAVKVLGEDVTGVSAPGRARRGLGRTFQVTQLCDTLTVRENVAMGREAALAGSGLFGQFAAAPASRRAIEDAAERAIRMCGILELIDTPAGVLSTGERRLVEVARCLAGEFDVLLMDEPSAGLDKHESARLAGVLRTIAAERGCAILLVEHDMAMVMDVCDYLYVLDFGKPLFEGTPEEVAASPAVQKAYLGASLVTKLATVEGAS